MPQQQNKNIFLLPILALLIYVVWMQVGAWIWPAPPKKPTAAQAEPDKGKEVAKPAAPGRGPRRDPTADDKLVTLGSDAGDSRFHLQFLLDPRGAGVRRVLANKFQHADSRGHAEWLDAAKKVPRPLELVLADLNRDAPSHRLFHFDPKDPDAERPKAALGEIEWKHVAEEHHNGPADDTHRAVFTTDAVAGLVITKTYTLEPGAYHVGLEVKVERKAGSELPPGFKFRYQLTGARGLPIEGEWYTTTFRNALIGKLNANGVPKRDFQDSRQVSWREGGEPVNRAPGEVILYGGTAVQFFASVVAVDDQQDKRDFLARARPTLETGGVRGRLKKIDLDKLSFVLTVDETNGWFSSRKLVDYTFDFYPNDEVRRELAARAEGDPLVVVFTTDEFDRRVATRVGSPTQIQPLFLEDVQVRLATEPFEVKPDAPVVHKYLLYNGPVKVAQLHQLARDPERAVDPELVNRYVHNLHLNTLTDYPSPGFADWFDSYTGWSRYVIIPATNLMHWVLGGISWLIPSFGLSIICLTVLVRGLMFPVSRKQALTSLRMQELAPELKKLQEKYKDDRQAMGLEQMALYRKYGINPFGSCWMLLLQMPIFMGLYYALQESILFRLAGFWPLWIRNLAAPDMLTDWGWGGEWVPFISTPDSYGGFFYLGPYFNLLPVIAVALMVMQQKLMTPPAMNEEQEMQMKMMKYMMIFMGLFFYKVAAGLCVYFIASSLWGFAERQLLPKRKPGAPLPLPPQGRGGIFQKMLDGLKGYRAELEKTKAAKDAAPAGAAPAPPADDEPRGRNKRKQDRGKRKPDRAAAPRAEEDAPSGLGGAFRKVRAWWQDVLEQARKK